MVFFESLLDVVLKPVAFDFDIGNKNVESGPESNWRLIQESCHFEFAIHHRLAKIVLEHTVVPTSRRTDDNIAQTDIFLWTWGSAADANQQPDSYVLECADQIPSDNCRRAFPVFAMRKGCDCDVMLAHASELVRVIVVLGLRSELFVDLVEEEPGCDELRNDGTDPADRI
ncbi:hypothetical protein SGCOL_002841 [Colletotrichum sp. CLE4]